MMFINLKEASDMVDRGILFRKMRELNFQRQLISYLVEYYFGDCIHTYSEGKRSSAVSDKRFVTRMSTFCNLLVVYLIELSCRLDRTGLRAWMSPGFILAYFLFADNLLLVGNNKSSLNKLKNVLEKWAVG